MKTQETHRFILEEKDRPCVTYHEKARTRDESVSLHDMGSCSDEVPYRGFDITFQACPKHLAVAEKLCEELRRAIRDKERRQVLEEEATE